MNSLGERLARRLAASETYFRRSTSCLQEEHSGFRPTESGYTVAAHVAHVALTVDWFLEGAFGDGFDFDVESHDAQARAVTSLAEARLQLEAAFQRATVRLTTAADDELQAALPDGPVMGGEPIAAIVGGIEEHTAHHRGALAVYSRLLGLEPPMPYM